MRHIPVLSDVQIGSSGVPNCSHHSPDHFDIPTHGSTMKVVDARAIIVGAVDPRDRALLFSRVFEADFTGP